MQTCVPVVEPTVGGKGCPAPLSSLFLKVTCRGLVFPSLAREKERLSLTVTQDALESEVS